jgi:hypothetical protein
VQGRYAYVANHGASTLQTFDLGGAYLQQLEAGGAELGTLSVDSNSMFAGDVNIQGGTTIGQSLQVAGSLGVSGGGAFTNSGDIGNWQSSTVLSGGRIGGKTVFANGYIYVLGGSTDGTNANAQSTVIYAQLMADGSIGSWNSTTAMPSTLMHHDAVYANGYIYVMAGRNNSVSTTKQNAVYYAKVNLDGTLSAWTTSSNSLPAVVDEGVSAVANGYIYHLAGYNSSGTAVNNVYYAKLNADGSVGAWQTSAATGLTARGSFAATTANGFLYVFGGDASTSVQYTSASSTGVLANWSSGTSLPGNEGSFTAYTANGYVYLVGGHDGVSTPSSAVIYNNLNSDGTLGATWKTSAYPLPATRYNYGGAINNGYLYVLGGTSPGGSTATYYASTARLSVGTSLDLVGLANGTLNGSGGSLTAGDILGVGDLQIQGTGTFVQGLSAGGNVNINGQLYANGNINGKPLSTYATNRFSDSAIQGNYLYGTFFSSNSLAIFDITNPNNFATSSISVTSISANCTGVNGIAVAGKYAYISCNTNHVMVIYNVSNPASPSFVSSISIGASFSTNLVVHGQYVITSSAIAGANGIYIFDVSNPASPKLVKNIGTTNNYGLAVQGNYLYAIDNGNLQVYDITNPSSPVAKGSRALSGAPINGGNFGNNIISVMGRYAYIADTTNSQVGIYDISNPTTIPAPTTISTGASSQPWVTAISGEELYVPTANGNIVTIDVSNPGSPVLTQTATVAGNLYTMAISGRYAFVSDRTAGSVYAIDLGGSYIQQLEAGGLQVDNVNVNGNTVLGGDVIVQGAAVFNQGISAMGGAAIQSAGTGTVALSVDNTTTGINLLQVRDMSQNFGSYISGGAFEGRNSYFGEEFNAGHNTTCTTPSTAGNGVNSYARGDYGNSGSATTCTAAGANIGGGELNFSHVLGAAAGACVGQTVTGLNGVERIQNTGSATASSTENCAENLAATTTTSNKIYLAANLPVVTMKVKATTLQNSANDRIQIGMVSSDSANTLGTNSPTQSIYFTNCSTWNNAAAPTGCGTTTWYGVTSTTGVGAATVVTCSTGSGSLTANFSYLRIEVRSSTDVHFFADYNTTNGITESECGSGSTTNITSSAMTPWMQVMHLTNAATNNQLDIDYFRSWQDDNVDPATAPNNTGDTNSNTAPDGSQIVTEAPVTPDPDQPDPSIDDSFFNFLGATSEDTVINGNLFVHGTIYADKIKANEIEGLSIFTDQLASLQQKLNEASSTSTNPDGTTTTNTIIQTATTTLNLSDGLTVGGDANFHGNVFFYKLVTFTEKTLFNNDVTFAAHVTTDGTAPTYNLEAGAGDGTDTAGNQLAKANVDGNDTSGSLNVTTGNNTAAGKVISVTFNKPFAKAPRVILSATNDQAAGVKYYVQSTATGFTIYLIDAPASGADLQFNYFVIQ